MIPCSINLNEDVISAVALTILPYIVEACDLYSLLIVQLFCVVLLFQLLYIALLEGSEFVSKFFNDIVRGVF